MTRISEPVIEVIVKVIAQPLMQNHPNLRTAARMLQHAADLENMALLHGSPFGNQGMQQ